MHSEKITPAPPETFDYSKWRHGGWYVHNVHYFSGAVGCVSRNYPDKKWRIACSDRHDVTYPNRDAAATGEWRIARDLETRARDLLAGLVDDPEHGEVARAALTDGGSLNHHMHLRLALSNLLAANNIREY